MCEIKKPKCIFTHFFIGLHALFSCPFPETQTRGDDERVVIDMFEGCNTVLLPFAVGNEKDLKGCVI